MPTLPRPLMVGAFSMPWQRRTNPWRERTNLRTRAERLRGVGPPVLAAPPPTDAQVIAGTILGIATWLSMGDACEETASSWDYRIAGNVCKCWTRSRTPWTLGFTGSMANE